MEKYISKSAIVAEIEKRRKTNKECMLGLRNLDYYQGKVDALNDTLSFLNTLEVKDPYEECIQYDSIKGGIRAHAETYSFNIESKLFNQLTKEQQELWRKEIEQACISGGDAGYLLAKDPRYKENLEVKEEILDESGKTNLMQKSVHEAFKRGYDMGVLQTTKKMNHNTKDVDLEKEFDKCCENHIFDDECEVYTARKFFELGLNHKK